MRKKGDEWHAESPTDLIGWDFDVITYDEEKDRFLVRATKRDTKEVRYVQASADAVPVVSLELRNSRRGQ